MATTVGPVQTIPLPGGSSRQTAVVDNPQYANNTAANSAVCGSATGGPAATFTPPPGARRWRATAGLAVSAGNPPAAAQLLTVIGVDCTQIQSSSGGLVTVDGLQAAQGAILQDGTSFKLSVIWNNPALITPLLPLGTYQAFIQVDFN